MSRLPALAVLVVGCIVASGCSGDPEADPTAATEPTTVATTATATATPTAPSTGSDLTEPSLPATAAKPGAKGAEAFVRYYIKLLNYAANTGDTSTYEAHSASCRGCEAYVAMIKDLYGGGGWFRRSEWTPSSLFVAPRTRPTTVFAQVRAAAFTIKDSAKERPHPVPADEYRLRYELSWVHGDWVVTKFEGE